MSDISVKGKDVLCTGAWIETFTGKKFHLLDPQPEEVCIEDIAHALSNQCRYTGHVKKFFSVAEHSWHVCKLCEHPMTGLLHDASEAYLSDLSRPVKQLTPVGPPYYEVEERMMKVIADKFDFHWPMPKDVKQADNAMLLAEKAQLMTALSWSDDVSSEEARKQVTPKVQLACWTPEAAEKVFLQKFYDLA